MDAVTGEWKRLNSDEFHDLRILLLTKYQSGDQIEKNEMGVVCSMDGGQERFMQDFGGEGRPEGKIPLGRLWRGWDEYVKINLKEVIQG
jgi:hypothetical protein